MSDETRTVTREQLAVALNETVGRHGWLRSTPPDPVEEWRMNAAAIFAALPTSTEGLDEVLARLDSAVTGWNGYNGDDLMPTVVAAHATLARLAALSPSPTEDPEP